MVANLKSYAAPRTCILAVALITLVPSALLSQSRYAGPFENYARTRDRAEFGKEMFDAERNGVDLRIDVPFLISIVASSGDQSLRDEARLKLGQLVYPTYDGGEYAAETANLFHPAVAVFESRMLD